MKRVVWVLGAAAAAAVALTAALAAQEPDSGAAPPANGAEAQQLREQIRQRWNQHVLTTLGLSDDQATKLQSTEQRFEEQRTPLRERQREINQSLRSELANASPNQQRVTELMGRQQENRQTLQQVDRDEDREMEGFLSPVQRARYQAERQRFRERVAEVIRHRREQRRERLAPRPKVPKRPRR
jgi:Spy/CpxP family protein refolding chaperone